MLKESARQLIGQSLAGLRRPVKLILFTSDVNCDACPAARELAAAIRAASPRVVLETYDLTMDRDKSQEYAVTRAPAFVVQGPGVRSVTFSGSVEDVALVLLLDAIAGVSDDREWFPGQVLGPLAMLSKPVSVQVLIENDCNLCRPVAETAIGLALSSRYVATEIIMADEYPELLSRYRVKVLPYTIFGPKLHLDGHVTESMFLEMLFQAEGKGAEAERRCMVCGTPSGDVICTACKTRIQAEAVDHKRKGEHLHERGSAAEGHRH
jgi:hypothetical protein